MSFSYAATGSGPSAGAIGWINFGNLTLKPGDSLTGLSGTLLDGTTVTFDLSSPLASEQNFIANPALLGLFGNVEYQLIPGNATMYTPVQQTYTNPSTIQISNIVVKDSLGNPVTNYTAVVADAESTNSFPGQFTEYWQWATDGSPWSLFTTIGVNPPTLAGVGTQNVTITGVNSTTAADYLMTTQSPKNLTLSTLGHQAIAVGFVVTKVTLQKNIGGRINSNDQFHLTLSGTPTAQATTTGTADGIQTPNATVYAIDGNTYNLSEIMAPGSVSSLSDYTQILSASNLTPGGTIPPTGSLPLDFTPAFGDIVTYTILNAQPETFTKSVDKANATIGDILTYTVTIHNPNDFTIYNVVMTDPTPVGTTYIGNLIMLGAAAIGTPPTGVTIPTFPPNADVTISWQVQVNTSPITTPITNFATVSIPDGTSGVTNTVSTQINHTQVAMLKSVDKQFATTGDTLTYTLNLSNTGNVPANNVTIVDALPTGATYVPGSITGTVAFTGTPTGTITLTSPIPASGTATITFKVKIGASVPSPNPLSNTATANYAYTVDPAQPNGAKGSVTTNAATTQVSVATLEVIKTVDKNMAYIGDTITYSISVKNSGNVPANNVIVTDLIPIGTILVPGSVTVSAPYTGSPDTGIQLTNSIAAGDTVSITFAVKVETVPNPNPIENHATTTFAYTVNPNLPDSVKQTTNSNIVSTVVFRYNFSQQVTDLIQSVALEEAALGNIANAEGAKIQAMVAMGSITPQELLCVNKSVSDMIDSITMLENILKQKLNAVSCQIDGTGTGC